MKNRYLGLIVFLLVFCVMGIPFIKMGFDSDSFGKVYSASQKELSLKIFTEQITLQFKPSNFKDVNTNFMSLYRPFQAVMFKICYKLFGLNGYAFFLVSIFFHALVSSILFFIYSLFLSSSYAFLLSLLFASHPAHTPSFIGLTCFIIPVYVFAFLAVLLEMLFIKKDKKYLHIFAGLSYFLSLFFYEMPLIIPFIYLLYLTMYQRDRIKNALIFFYFTLLYLVIRFFSFGGMPSSSGKLTSTIGKVVNNAIASSQQAIKPFWGLQDYSKISALSVCLIFIGFIFYHLINNHSGRKKMLFYIASFFLASWVLFLQNGSSRYFYIAIPFFNLIIYELVIFYFKNKKAQFLFLGLLITWGLSHTIYALHRRSDATYRRDLAFRELALKYKGTGSNFLYLGMPQYYNGDIFLLMSGLSQATKIVFNDTNVQALHFEEARMYSRSNNAGSIRVLKIDGGFRFICDNPNNAFIMASYDWKEGERVSCSMGSIIVNKKHDGWRATDIDFLIDDQWVNDKTKIISWDLDTFSFVEIGKGN